MVLLLDGPRPWSSLFSTAKANTDCSLKFEEPKVVDGEFVIYVSNEELNASIDYWKFALVGHFVGAKLYFPKVKERIISMWNPKGDFEALSLPSSFLIFRFSQEDDMMIALEGGPWFIQGLLIVLKRWAPGMTLERVSLSTIPIWVRVFHLPLEFWSAPIIGKIMSGIGKLLYKDNPTTTKSYIGYARICVEMDARQSLLENLVFNIRDEKYKVQLVDSSSRNAILQRMRSSEPRLHTLPVSRKYQLSGGSIKIGTNMGRNRIQNLQIAETLKAESLRIGNTFQILGAEDVEGSICDDDDLLEPGEIRAQGGRAPPLTIPQD
ncbi:DUF4283 domain-containing protein [Canna indica]|uniref:DUF4283 domain-containing protein n=1 Tax=Canna indica TaxID=4628 RepID=A0AAQ3K3E1_9LILI|nr:DUF4283 domain-containing protein [Canna indica]